MRSNLYYFAPCAAEQSLRTLEASYGLIALTRGGAKLPTWQFPAVFVADAQDDLYRLEKVLPKSHRLRIVCLLDGEWQPPFKLKSSIYALLPREVPPVTLAKTVEMAFESLRAQEDHSRTRRELRRAVSDVETLNKIGTALSTERNADSLLELILSKSREITSADAGSLYLVEENEHDGQKHLVFKLTQNDSQSVPFRRFTMQIDTSSIAGYAASTGQILNIKDAYRIRNLPFRFNRDFDQKFGYRTKSMLVLPMTNQKDEVIGVLQLINSKKNPRAMLLSAKDVREEVCPFSARSRDLAASLASQAAVALENNLLYRQIEDMFGGFVKAAVTAIESRDPTTFGHSGRVATLTVALAETVDRVDRGPYKDIHFAPEDIRQIRYASILHDFGKVGVREDVLVKSKKLYGPQLELIKKRFQYIRKALEVEACRKKLDHVMLNGNLGYEQAFALIDAHHDRELQSLDEFLQNILEANEPTLMAHDSSEKLLQIAEWSFHEPSMPSEPLLTQEELQLLYITKGSLNADERTQIERHVIHSFNFLKEIKWTKELTRVPLIAQAHHEKLNGSGYPYRRKSEDIPFEAKMMTISDIYDALTASDRPYKRAVPVDRALDIIGGEVKSQLLDPILFDLFVEAKIYQLTARA